MSYWERHTFDPQHFQTVHTLQVGDVVRHRRTGQVRIIHALAKLDESYELNMPVNGFRFWTKTDLEPVEYSDEEVETMMTKMRHDNAVKHSKKVAHEVY